MFHLNPSLLPGGWLGVDLFFVLSGFLITSLLLAERRVWGSINVMAFWLGRARRLLPALMTMLLTVVVASALFAPQGRLQDIGKDVLSAIAYVANWRFLLGDEAYFGTIALPSPVRHTWSLAIEEQFYLVFPLVLIGLGMVLRSRRALAGTLFALALVSAWWMAHLYQPGTEPSRVYYGTDTRIFELLIGASAAALWGTSLFRRKRTHLGIQRMSGYLAWPALAIVLFSAAVLSESAAAVFQGGLLVLSLITVLPILAAVSARESHFQRALSWKPLVWIGLISYPIYLWHWPIIVFLSPDLVGFAGFGLAMLRLSLTVSLAWLTYRYIELPIRREGFGALIPRRRRLSRAITGVAIPALAIGALGLPMTARALPTVEPGERRNVELVPAQYTVGQQEHVVALAGNSVPESLGKTLEANRYPDLDVRTVTNYGCDPFDGDVTVDGKTPRRTKACQDWRRAWPQQLKNSQADVLVFFVPHTLVADHRIDGKVARFGTPEHDAFIFRSLDWLRRSAARAGIDHLAVVTPTCHRLADFGVDPLVPRFNSSADTARINRITKSWARNTNTPIIDLNAAVCPGGYHDTVNDVPLYSDGMHFTKQSGPIVWDWFAPQVKDILEKPS